MEREIESGTRGRGWHDGGRAISLSGRGEGRQLRSAGWTIGWDGMGRGTGKRDREKRLERRELSHSAVATFLAGLVGASRHISRLAIVGGDGDLCQCRLLRTCREPLGLVGMIDYVIGICVKLYFSV